MQRQHSRFQRSVALTLMASLTLPVLLAGCGGGGSSSSDYGGGMRGGPARPVPQTRRGMTTAQKGVLLVGAAALYYMYRRNQKAQQQRQSDQQVQYYLSKNGRVYYRDPNNPQQVHWVSPPSSGFRVPESEAGEYRDFEGYNNQRSGRDLRGVIPAAP
jgi:hypothetical protein